MENPISKNSPKISIALFALALLCFFFPFVEVSFVWQKIAESTGFKLVTGGKIEEPDMFGGKKKVREFSGILAAVAKEVAEAVEETDGDPLAILAFLSAIAGIIVSSGIFRGKPFPVIRAIIGISGAISLLLLKAKLEKDILKQGEGLLQIKYTIAFWLTFVLFLISSFFNFFFFREEEK